jgi:hypothetical protein
MNKYIKAKKKYKMYVHKIRKMMKQDNIKDDSLIVMKLPNFMNAKSFIDMRNEFLEKMQKFITQKKIDFYTDRHMPITIKSEEICLIDDHLKKMMDNYDIPK